MSYRQTEITKVCDFQGGTQPPRSGWREAPADGYIRMLQIRDFTQGKICHVVYVKETINLKTCNKDDILIARYGASIGKILTGLSGAYNVALIKTIPDPNKLSKRFLYYFLNSPKAQNFFNTNSSRAAQAGFNKDDLRRLKIPLIPLTKQDQFVFQIEKSESVLEKRRQTIRLADEFLKNTFLDMFGGSGSNLKGFKRKTIRNLVKKIFNEDPKRFPDKKYSYVDISSVDNQLKKVTNVKRINGVEAPSRARQLLQPQDILVSTVRPNLNAVGILPNSFDNPIGSTGFCVLRANKELVQPEYLFEICKSPFFIKSLVNVAKGASYPAVSDNDILGLSILLPSLPEQQKFADIVQKVERLKEKQKQSETELQNLFNALMQKAFNRA